MPASRATAADTPRQLRRGYLDWVRGLAVLIMIEAHLMDSWTAGADRASRAFEWAMLLGGMGAPLFLFLAGAAVPLAAGSRQRRSGSVPDAARTVARRGLEIFGLAFLFRVQAWALGWSSPRALLKVDILNIMGPSIACAALLWRVADRVPGRVAIFALAAASTAFATPIVHNLPLGTLPDPLEAYISPVPGLSNFVFFPWMGFVFAGAVLGVLVDATPHRKVAGTFPGKVPATFSGEARLNFWFGAGGVTLAVSALAASYLPPIYANTDFWTTSPTYFLIKVGVMSTAVALAYAWDRRPGRPERWSPMQALGRSSLFVYWIHVEMVYGLISLPLHKALTLVQAGAALAAFAAFMLACALAKERVVALWRIRRAGAAGGRAEAVTG